MNFFAVLLFSLLLGDLLWFAWAWLRLRHRPGWRWAALAFATLQAGGLLLVIIERFLLPEASALLSRPWLSAVFIWHLLTLPMFGIGWLSWNLGMLPVHLGRRLVGRKPLSDEDRRANVTRREFVTTSLAAAPAILTLGAAGFSQPQLQHFRIRRIEVPLANLPPALDGLTLAHVTDLHVGRFTRGAVLREIVAATNELRADLVLLTGDLINYDLDDLPAALDLVKAMRGTHGVFMCEGNHDLIESPLAFSTRTREAGVALLVNETATLDIRGTPVQLLGLPWAHGDDGHEAALRPLLFQRRMEAFPILLAHHPHAFDFAHGIPLTLAGHTHGGQLMVSEQMGFGPAIFRYWSGLYRQDNRALVVSNGVGNWFPLRLRAPAEILHLTLRRA